MSLSDRVRPDVEAAPWVIEEIKKLEAERDALLACITTFARDLYGQAGAFLAAIDAAKEEK